MTIKSAKWFDDSVYMKNKLMQMQEKDPTYTLSKVYSDFEAAGFKGEEGHYRHFLKYGNRASENISPNDFFNTEEYYRYKAKQYYNLSSVNEVTQQQSDFIKKAISNAGMSAWTHYTKYGTAEGINPSSQFNTSAYMDAKLNALNNNQHQYTVHTLTQAFKNAGLSALAHAFQYGVDNLHQKIGEVICWADALHKKIILQFTDEDISKIDISSLSIVGELSNHGINTVQTCKISESNFDHIYTLQLNTLQTSNDYISIYNNNIHNYLDMYLYDEKGVICCVSNSLRNEQDFLLNTLSPGKYYLRIIGDDVRIDNNYYNVKYFIDSSSANDHPLSYKPVIKGLPEHILLNAQQIANISVGNIDIFFPKTTINFNDQEENLKLKLTSYDNSVLFNSKKYNLDHENSAEFTGTYEELSDILQNINIDFTANTLSNAANKYYKPYDRIATFSISVTTLNNISESSTVYINKSPYTSSTFIDDNFDSNHYVYYVNNIENAAYSTFSKAKNGSLYYSSDSIFDAEKDGSTHESEMCWAASASNLLAYTGWGIDSDKENAEDLIFDEFSRNWEGIQGSNTNLGIKWYFDRRYFKFYDHSWDQPLVNSGNYLNTSPSKFVYTYTIDKVGGLDLMNIMTNFLYNGYGTSLHIRNDIIKNNSHIITCWGFSYDSSLDPLNKNLYTGIFFTDSDDNKNDSNPDDVLHYYPLIWMNDKDTYFIKNYGNSHYYIDAAFFLQPHNSYNNKNIGAPRGRMSHVVATTS